MMDHSWTTESLHPHTSALVFSLRFGDKSEMKLLKNHLFNDG